MFPTIAGSATIAAVGADGWYRITFSATLTAGNQVRFHMGSANGGEVSYAGSDHHALLGTSLEKARLLQLCRSEVYRTS